MNKPIPYIVQGNNVVLVIDNESYNINRDSHSNYHKILEAIRTGEWDTIKDLIDVGKTITNYSKGKLSIVNGELFWDGRVFHNSLAKRIIAMYEQGFEINPMINFMDNLMSNPSYRAVEELYGFLEKNTLPITPDGCFMAYKRVKTLGNGNFVDYYTGKISNNVGDTVTMERNAVNDDKDATCSAGLHFCSLSYLTQSGYADGGIILLVKINPKDVVSIPSDYNDQKGRCCAYTVEAIHGKDAHKESKEYSQPVANFGEQMMFDYDEYSVDFEKHDDIDDTDDDDGHVSIFKPV